MLVERLKRIIRKAGGTKTQRLIIFIIRFFKLQNSFILFSFRRAEKNKVNINYWFGEKNLGDAISPVIVDYVAKKNNIDVNSATKKTSHLYAVGSIITAGCQDCIIWGSGVLNTQILYRLEKRKLDVRLVRGPLTRLILQEYGYNVPEKYGDPAVLMPMIYNPQIEKKYKYGIIFHMDEEKYDVDHKDVVIDIKTDDYRCFIDQIKQCEVIISSSLHGIIFAEIYGVPAILLKPKVDLIKYYDYYYSTGRYEFPIVENIGQAKGIQPIVIPDFTNLRSNVIDTFPIDLWDDHHVCNGTQQYESC